MQRAAGAQVAFAGSQFTGPPARLQSWQGAGMNGRLDGADADSPHGVVLSNDADALNSHSLLLRGRLAKYVGTCRRKPSFSPSQRSLNTPVRGAFDERRIADSRTV
jgi:hypothetical protein